MSIANAAVPGQASDRWISPLDGCRFDTRLEVAVEEASAVASLGIEALRRLSSLDTTRPPRSGGRCAG
jgi:hypothetical protein